MLVADKNALSLPHGILKMGETTKQSAARQAWEQANARVTADHILTIHEKPDGKEILFVLRGRLEEPDRIAEAGFSLHKMDELRGGLAGTILGDALDVYEPTRAIERFAPRFVKRDFTLACASPASGTKICDREGCGFDKSPVPKIVTGVVPRMGWQNIDD